MKKAVMDRFGTCRHWLNEMGQSHRSRGPAREWSNGDKGWFLHGRMWHKQTAGASYEFLLTYEVGKIGPVRRINFPGYVPGFDDREESRP